MSLKHRIEAARRNAAELERLYRLAQDSGNEAAFKQAIGECAAQNPDDVLFSAWAYRLGVRPLPLDEVEPQDQPVEHNPSRRWFIAVAASVVVGLFYAFLSHGKPPVPFPGEADPRFWIGWSPLAALGLLFYLGTLDSSRKRLYVYAGMAVIPIAIYLAVNLWSRTDDVALLSALHLPFVAWAAIGAAVSVGRPAPARQGYAFLVKSVETVVVGGIYFAAGALFVGLTYGIFAVLGITLPENDLQKVAAWGVGAIPVLAVATIYNPLAAPENQDWSGGISRILGVLARLMLPLALGVLAVYMFWFIPAYFWRPFQEREVLIVYNATILAVLVLITMILSGPDYEHTPRQKAVLRYAVQALVALTLLLNLYALAAIVSRTLSFGLTPNRYAVLGWNCVTLIMLAVLGFRLWRAHPDTWIFAVREALARVSIVAVAWIVWVVIALPLSF